MLHSILMVEKPQYYVRDDLEIYLGTRGGLITCPMTADEADVARASYTYYNACIICITIISSITEVLFTNLMSRLNRTLSFS